MTLASYVAALRSTAELPEPVRARAMSPRSYSTDDLAEQEEGRHIEEQVATMERFSEEQPAERLPDRSVLTLAGLADVRFGARLLAAAEAMESEDGTGVLGPRRARSAGVLLADPDVEQMVADIERAASYDPAAAAAGGPAQVDLGQLAKELQAQVDAVLKTGESAVRDLAGAVSWGAVAGSAGKAIAGAVERSALLQAAAKGLGWLKRLALRAIEAGFKALEKAVGGALGSFLEKARQRLAAWLDGGGAGELVGRLLDADRVAPSCIETVRAAGATEAQQAAALGAATHVAEHAERLAGMSDKVTDVVGWFGGLVWKSPVGPYLAAGFVVAIGAAIWQVQDHLDTTEPFALPDVTEGMRSAVASAVSAA